MTTAPDGDDDVADREHVRERDPVGRRPAVDEPRQRRIAQRRRVRLRHRDTPGVVHRLDAHGHRPAVREDRSEIESHADRDDRHAGDPPVERGRDQQEAVGSDPQHGRDSLVRRPGSTPTGTRRPGGRSRSKNSQDARARARRAGRGRRRAVARARPPRGRGARAPRPYATRCRSTTTSAELQRRDESGLLEMRLEGGDDARVELDAGVTPELDDRLLRAAPPRDSSARSSSRRMRRRRGSRREPNGISSPASPYG